MNYFLLVLIIILSSVNYIESTIGPNSRKTVSRSSEKVTPTRSSSSAVELILDSSPVPQESNPPTDSDIIQRNLLQESINGKTILENYQAYCTTCTEIRQFNNPTLIYITPWNNRGYDLVKIFFKKFDYISPVWFHIKRIDRKKYYIEGKHDIDSKWIETLKEKRSDIRIVPRVSFEKWSVDDINELIRSEDEKQELAIALKEFLLEYNDLFDGYVLELLAQFANLPKGTVDHVLIDIAEKIHQIDTNSTHKKEILLSVPPLGEYFDKYDFRTLSEHIDAFIVMTYDFPTRDPGPVSPIGKFNRNLISYLILFKNLHNRNEIFVQDVNDRMKSNHLNISYVIYAELYLMSNDEIKLQF